MVFIKELYPNPPGSDVGGEWIKLGNDGAEVAPLLGWSLKDASGKTFLFFNERIAGWSELILRNSETKISLGNKGDEVFLYDSRGNIVDRLAYSGVARDGAMVSKNGEFYFSEEPGLIEQDIFEAQAIAADFMPVSFWITTATIGIVFGFVAVFTARRIMEN